MLYILIIGPFTFFSAQKTKYLQVVGFFMRIIGKFSFTSTMYMFTICFLIYIVNCTRIICTNLFIFFFSHYCNGCSSNNTTDFPNPKAWIYTSSKLYCYATINRCFNLCVYVSSFYPVCDFTNKKQKQNTAKSGC